MEIKEAVKVLVKQLKEDPGYREAWKANIAMSFKDEYARTYPLQKDFFNPNYELHSIANKAADNFLNLLCMDRADEP